MDDNRHWFVLDFVQLNDTLTVALIFFLFHIFHVHIYSTVPVRRSQVGK